MQQPKVRVEKVDEHRWDIVVYTEKRYPFNNEETARRIARLVPLAIIEQDYIEEPL
jgi:hypothetical protein